MTNYLGTGVAGFIGARVVEVLIDQGHVVTGVDNFNNAYDVRLKEYHLQRCGLFLDSLFTSWIFQRAPRWKNPLPSMQ